MRKKSHISLAGKIIDYMEIENVYDYRLNFYFCQNFSLTFSVSGGILVKNYDYKRSSTMIWKNQFLHLTNGDVSAVYGDSALFFK